MDTPPGHAWPDVSFIPLLDELSTDTILGGLLPAAMGIAPASPPGGEALSPCGDPREEPYRHRGPAHITVHTYGK